MKSEVVILDVVELTSIIMNVNKLLLLEFELDFCFDFSIRDFNCPGPLTLHVKINVLQEQ